MWTFARMQPRGVRHKTEDVAEVGPVRLVWGTQTETRPSPQPETRSGTSADVVKLRG